MSRTHRLFSYRSRGIYAPQVARWQNAYGPEALMVLKAEAFYEQPNSALQRAHDHVGVEPKPTRKPSNENAKNASNGSAMRTETRKELEAFFAPHNARLYDLLGRDMGW